MTNKFKISNIFVTSKERKQHQAGNQVVDVYWVQYISSVIASLAMSIMALQLTWFSPALIMLKDEELSPIHVISSTESAWINSFLQVGALPSPFLGSFLANKIGRKYGLICATIPNVISCLLIIFVQNIYMLYAARIFCGIAVGVTFAIVPVYLSEISSPKIRGFISTISPIMLVCGSVAQFVLLPLMTLQSNGLMMLIFTVMVGIGIYFLPESPYFYIMKNEEDKVKKSLQILRQTKNVTQELSELKLNWDRQQTDNSKFFDIFKSKVNQRSLIIIAVSMICQQMSGTLVLMSYVAMMFVESKIPIPEYYGALLLMCAFTVAIIGNSLVVDKLGRRPLYLTSSLASGVCAVLTGVYFACESLYGVDTVSKYYLIFVTIAMFYVLAGGIGMFSLPYIFVGELFDTRFRAIAGSMLSTFGAALGFIVIQSYEFVHDKFGSEYMFWFFALVCMACTAIGIFYIPETKGKTFSEIQTELHNIVGDNSTVNKV